MLRRLLDSLNTVIEKPERLIWKKHIATFKLKYPTVEVWNHVFGPATPGAFLVWRRLPKDYIVDLYPSAEEVQERIRFYKLLNQRLHTSFPERLSDVVYVGEGGLLNWGRFDYKCEAGVGEFCADRYGGTDTFVRNFVLAEDQHLFHRDQ